MPRVPAFEEVTETTAGVLTAEAADMMYTRYALAAKESARRRVLELGCGAGLGLGLIGREARIVVGGDYSRALLASGRTHYGPRVPFVRLSAEALPFRSGAFDVVLCLEASYYIPNPELAFDEVTRVMAGRGTALFVNANPDRPDFVASQFSVHYHSATEFRAELGRRGLRVTVSGGFPLGEGANGPARLVGRALPWLRRVFQAAGLVPRTLRGRARLKRLAFGRMRSIPPEIPAGFAREAPLHPLPAGPAPGFKVIYVRASRG
jgi:SAM-dependent methyltransferase